MLTGFSKYLFENMPPKTNLGIPADATEMEAKAIMDTMRKERTVSKREFTRKKRILDQMLMDDDPFRKDRQDLADLTMQELNQQYQLVMEKNRIIELNLKENEEDDYILEVDDAMKNTQLLYVRWKRAGKTEDEHFAPAPLAPTRNEGLYTAIGLNYDVRKSFREKFSGADVRDYASFKINWNDLEGRLTEVGYSEAQMLMELKKCLTGDALELIKRLPDEDAQYKRAQNLLDKNFKNPIKVTESVISDLLNAPKMSNSSESIGATYNAMIQAEQTLDGLGVTAEQKAQLLFNVICESKLNARMLQRWTSEKNKKKNDHSPLGHDATSEDLLNLLLEQKLMSIRLEEDKKKNGESESKSDKVKQSSSSGKKKDTLPGNFSIQKDEKNNGKDRKKECLACRKPGHALLECYKFKNLPSGEDRRKFLNDSKINVCRNCLKGLHQTKECRQPSCPVKNCGLQHHTLLHEARDHKANPVQTSTGLPQGNPPGPSQGHDHSGFQKMVLATSAKTPKNPILQSCQAWALSPSGEKFLVRVFLDSGSEITLIRRELSNQMGLQGPTTPLQISVAGGASLPQTMEKRVKFQLQALDGGYTSARMEGVTTKQITKDLRRIEVDPANFEHLKGIDFTETYPRSEKEVDILIGVQHYTSLLKGEIIRGHPEEPTAVATKLGYVLSGSA